MWIAQQCNATHCKCSVRCACGRVCVCCMFAIFAQSMFTNLHRYRNYFDYILFYLVKTISMCHIIVCNTIWIFQLIVSFRSCAVINFDNYYIFVENILFLLLFDLYLFQTDQLACEMCQSASTWCFLYTYREVIRCFFWRNQTQPMQFNVFQLCCDSHHCNLKKNET